ncbi:MAG: YtxH domain-containing protein [Verrucomicrobia bacterium]|nr:YtxH domain-containing protein [Verrucomicrobiota bacterium]
MDVNNRQKDFFWGAVLGGTLATLSVLLLTTKKGKEIQRRIGEIYDEVEENVKGKVSDAKHALKDKYDEVKEKAEETAEHAGKKFASKFKEEHHK